MFTRKLQWRYQLAGGWAARWKRPKLLPPELVESIQWHKRTTFLVLLELRGNWGRETKMRGRVTGGGRFFSLLVQEPPPSLSQDEPI
jgi:hypothetical protein